MNIRDKLTPAQRAAPLIHTIDPGFVHHRKIQTILGPQGMQLIDEGIRQLPDMPQWQREVRIDHIYTSTMLGFCAALNIMPLEEILALRKGKLFCSTETLAPCSEVFDSVRAISIWVPRGDYPFRVEFHYSTRHISSDTLRSRLHQGGSFSIIAEQYNYDEEKIIFDPLIIGSPWLEPGDVKPDFAIMFFGYTFYENFIEDFDEFKKVEEVPEPPSPKPMKHISEAAFKTCLSDILGDTKYGDWGGETSDYYSAHLHLQGRRTTAAFVLKGPARFQPMNLNHLGKHNDQIVRLSHEPADVLIVQHCHDILPPVRETLRAFAVQPSRPRRYCLIDGRDSLRLLYAYDLYDKAQKLSSKRTSSG
jgi:hypothetical protein